MRPLLKAAFAAILLVTAAGSALGCKPREDIVYVEPDDVEMNAAIAEARKTLPVFWRVYEGKAPDIDTYMLKIKLPMPDGTPEHIWLDLLTHNGDAVTGTLFNKPVNLPTRKQGDVVTVPVADISDWTYRKGGMQYGHFTTRVIVKRMPTAVAEEQAAVLSQTPLEPEQS